MGYIDVVADKTKTAQGFRGREGTELTAYSWGLAHDTWALDWLQARARLGLHAEAGGVLMPSLEVGQQFSTTKAANSQEIGIHLREDLVKWGIDADEAALYIAHAMKATFLSWCAKAGVPTKARRNVGRTRQNS